jgi:hypothetical protein
MDTMFLYEFQNDDLGDGAHLTDTFFKILKYDSTTPLFRPNQSKSTQLGTIILLYNLKEKFDMSNRCFSKILR